MKRLISAFHKSFSVFGFWLLAFLFFCFLFPPALKVPADFIVSTNIRFYGGISGSYIHIRFH